MSPFEVQPSIQVILKRLLKGKVAFRVPRKKRKQKQHNLTPIFESPLKVFFWLEEHQQCSFRAQRISKKEGSPKNFLIYRTTTVVQCNALKNCICSIYERLLVQNVVDTRRKTKFSYSASAVVASLTTIFRRDTVIRTVENKKKENQKVELHSSFRGHLERITNSPLTAPASTPRPPRS